MKHLLLFLCLMGCAPNALPSSENDEACGALAKHCCVGTATGDMAGSEYVFACAYGLWCEHDDGGVGGICR